MRDNIFLPSFGNRPKVLVGRETILQQFEYSMTSPPGSRERALLLLGQRGSGKTILLLEFAEIARNHGLIVTSPTIVSKGMLDQILEKLRGAGAEYLSKPQTKVSGGSISAMGFGAGIQLQEENTEPKSFTWNVSDLCRQFTQKGKSVLILLDEVQANQDELRQLISAYQEMVGEGLDVMIVMAGLPGAVSSVLNDRVLTFLNRARKLELPPLKDAEIDAYYHSAFRSVDVSISDARIARASKEAEGSPYMMQLIGHYITVYAEEGSEIGDFELSGAINRSVEEFQNDICLTTLAALSDKDIEFLVAMAKENEVCGVSEITARLGCADSHTQTYKRRLIQAGVIQQPRRGMVSFAVPYLREYLQTEYIN